MNLYNHRDEACEYIDAKMSHFIAPFLFYFFGSDSDSLVSSGSSEDVSSSDDLSDSPPPPKQPVAGYKPQSENVPTLIVTNSTTSDSSKPQHRNQVITVKQQSSPETRKDARVDSPWDR